MFSQNPNSNISRRRARTRQLQQISQMNSNQRRSVYNMYQKIYKQKKETCEDAFKIIMKISQFLLITLIISFLILYMYTIWLKNYKIKVHVEDCEDKEEIYKIYIDEYFCLNKIQNQLLVSILLLIVFVSNQNSLDYRLQIIIFTSLLLMNIWFTYLFFNFFLRKNNLIKYHSKNEPSLWYNRELKEKYYEDYFATMGNWECK